MENQEERNQRQNGDASSSHPESGEEEQPELPGNSVQGGDNAGAQNEIAVSAESLKTTPASGLSLPLNPATRGRKTVNNLHPAIDKTKEINLKGSGLTWTAIKVAAILASQAVVAFLFVLFMMARSGKDNNQRFANFDAKINAVENLVAQATQKNSNDITELARSVDTMSRVNQGMLGTMNTLSEAIRKISPPMEVASSEKQRQEQKSQASQTEHPSSTPNTPPQGNLWHLRVVTLQNIEKNKKGAEELAEYLRSKGIPEVRVCQSGKLLSVDAGDFADMSAVEAKSLKEKIVEITYKGKTFKDAYFVQY